jgi:uridine phosphorylase
MLNFEDYHEHSVVTPEASFKYSGQADKLNEIDTDKFILIFPYMKNFINKVESFEFKKIDWFYPELRILNLDGEKIGIAISRVGAPCIGMLLEDLIYIGGKYFILTGGVGVLLEKIQRGDIIILDGTIRSEGVSYHYFPTEKEIKPSNLLVSKLVNMVKGAGINSHIGKVWTTDVPYRETPSRIKECRKNGAICVDMEASAFLVVAEYHRVDAAVIFYGGDYVSENGWNFRKDYLDRSKKTEENLFEIITEALKGHQ